MDMEGGVSEGGVSEFRSFGVSEDGGRWAEKRRERERERERNFEWKEMGAISSALMNRGVLILVLLAENEGLGPDFSVLRQRQAVVDEF